MLVRRTSHVRNNDIKLLFGDLIERLVSGLGKYE